MALDESTRKALSKIGRMGGKASAKKLTKQQRIERARKAGKASQARPAEHYLRKLTVEISTPLQRLQNLAVLSDMIRDWLSGLVSDDVLQSVKTKIKEFDQRAEKRGVEDPIAAVVNATEDDWIAMAEKGGHA
ncbi:MAG: hypothetical protein ABSD75_28930 [Terriglobales bacterium]|jgi:general stress protein YciG